MICASVYLFCPFEQYYSSFRDGVVEYSEEDEGEGEGGETVDAGS